MVCDWGMTELGPVAYGDNKDHVFLGQEVARNQNFSEQTAQKIDEKIYEIVQKQYLRSLEILKEHRKALDICAEALLEHETIDGKHVHEILEFGEIRSPFTKPQTVELDEPEEEEEDGAPKKAAKKDDDKGGLAGEEAPAGAPA
jgi:cell division protease FtsH